MIGLVYLVWAPLGQEHLDAFLRSYNAHSAGAEHELIVLLNGARRPSSLAASHGPSTLSEWELVDKLKGTAHRLIVMEAPTVDLAAYDLAAHELEHRRLCFLNSYSEILADDWLGCMSRAADMPGVGLVGATGSWESKAEMVGGPPMHWAYQVATLKLTRAQYERFPNPHIRTTAFMLDRDLALATTMSRAHDKPSAYLVESGRRSITRQVEERGLRAVVVGRDGRTYERQEWPESRTFRSGGQENLLVADNRTREWQIAPANLQRRWSRYAWGHPGDAARTRWDARLR